MRVAILTYNPKTVSYLFSLMIFSTTNQGERSWINSFFYDKILVPLKLQIKSSLIQIFLNITEESQTLKKFLTGWTSSFQKKTHHAQLPGVPAEMWMVLPVQTN